MSNPTPQEMRDRAILLEQDRTTLENTQRLAALLRYAAGLVEENERLTSKLHGHHEHLEGYRAQALADSVSLLKELSSLRATFKANAEELARLTRCNYSQQIELEARRDSRTDKEKTPGWRYIYLTAPPTPDTIRPAQLHPERLRRLDSYLHDLDHGPVQGDADKATELRKILFGDIRRQSHE